MAKLEKFYTTDEGGIRFLWRRLVSELASLSTQLTTWANDRFIQSVNGKSGSSITISKEDIGLSNVDNTADKDKIVAHSATSGNADTLDGKHAEDFLLKTKYEDFERVVATSLTDLDDRKADRSELIAIDDKKVDKETGKGLSTNDYTNEDKTKLSGIEAGAQKNTVTSVAGKTGDVAIDIDDVSGLQGVLDSKQDTLPFTSTPSDSNKVVTQNELKSAVTGKSDYLGTIDSIASLSTTASKGDFYRVRTAWEGVHVGDMIIAEKDNPSAAIDGVNWSLMHNEMDTDTTYTFEDGTDGFIVTPSVGDPQKVNVSVKKVNGHSVESDVPANAKFTDTIIDNVAGDGIEVSGEHGENISLNTETKTAIDNAKSDHTNLGGHTVGKDVPSDAVFTDYQATKAGHYNPADERTLSPDTSVLRDTTRDMAFVGAVHEDEKGHVVSVDTCAILAFTDAEIAAIIDQVTAEIAEEMA